MSEAPTRTTSLTLDLPTDVVEKLGALAERTGGTVADLVAEAIADRLDYLEWKIAAVQEAIDDVDAGGPTYSNEEVLVWIESWVKPDELPPPG